MDNAPEWTLDQIAGIFFGVSSPAVFELLRSSLRLYKLYEALKALLLSQGRDEQGLMASSFFLALKVDEFIARAQRKQLGLCEMCGGVTEAATCTLAGCPLRSPNH